MSGIGRWPMFWKDHWRAADATSRMCANLAFWGYLMFASDAPTSA